MLSLQIGELKLSDDKEQEMLKRKQVKQGADPTLLNEALSKMPQPNHSEESKAHYDQRMARLEALFNKAKAKREGTQ